MVTNAITKVKVDKSVKPIHFKLRQQPKLKLGAEYWVSFGANIAFLCILREANPIDGRTAGIIIDIPIKPKSKKGFIDSNGSISHEWHDRHFLSADEIGTTPEEAVINTVTS